MLIARVSKGSDCRMVLPSPVATKVPSPNATDVSPRLVFESRFVQWTPSGDVQRKLSAAVCPKPVGPVTATKNPLPKDIRRGEPSCGAERTQLVPSADCQK